MLAENLQRKALDPVETALACRALRDRGMSVDELCKHSGLGAATLKQHMLVLDLPSELRDLVAGYRLALGAVPHLLRLRTKEQQVRIGRQAAAENWLVREVEVAVAGILAPMSPARPTASASAPRVAAPQSVASRPASGHARGGPRTTPAGSPKARVVDLFCDLVTLLRREPKLIADAAVREMCCVGTAPEHLAWATGYDLDFITLRLARLRENDILTDDGRLSVDYGWTHPEYGLVEFTMAILAAENLVRRGEPGGQL